MSLFGTSPEDPSAGDPARFKSSLFADEPATGGSSLFADDDGDDSSSPWNAQNNTAKRTARRDLARTLLPNTDVPESYIDAYDLILNSGDRVGSGIGLTSVREILSSSGLTATDQSKILNLVASGDHESFSGLGRGEFNVLLALVGLAQEGEDLSFDAVDDRRKSGLMLRPYVFIYLLFGILSNTELMQNYPSQRLATSTGSGRTATRALNNHTSDLLPRLSNLLPYKPPAPHNRKGYGELH